MSTETTVRKKAAQCGYTLAKSRNRNPCHLDDAGLYQLVDDRNHVVLGGRFDATLEEVDEYLASEQPPHLPAWDR
ncbi:MAG TPA: hypothetical protein VK196_00225 [Magnetospirillum sp.]|nr:hypothetical protein [Magnetospirillum sp.]